MVKKANVEDDFADALADPPGVSATDEKPKPAAPPPNGGGQVPAEVGTQVPTTRGTNVGRKDEAPEEEDLDFSLNGMLSETIDPEVDWRKAGWSAKRYRKKTVETLVRINWRGYRTEQELVDAALAAFMPDSVQKLARDKALRGEL